MQLESTAGKTLAKGLEFAPGTTDECKRLVQTLLNPAELFGAYRQARTMFKTGDLVLRISEQDPSGFEAETRTAYVKRLREFQGPKGIPLLMRGIAEKTAHSIVKLPFESDAMWLIVVRGPKAVPLMCVIYATPYQMSVGAN